MGNMTDDAFIGAFEACVIPRVEWTHAAHIRMARLYLLRFPIAEAIAKAQANIARYNLSLGNTTGYHDTITVASMRIVASRMQPDETYDEFRNRNHDLDSDMKGVLKQYYSEELLFYPKLLNALLNPINLQFLSESSSGFRVSAAPLCVPHPSGSPTATDPS